MYVTPIEAAIGAALELLPAALAFLAVVAALAVGVLAYVEHRVGVSPRAVLWDLFVEVFSGTLAVVGYIALGATGLWCLGELARQISGELNASPLVGARLLLPFAFVSLAVYVWLAPRLVRAIRLAIVTGVLTKLQFVPKS